MCADVWPVVQRNAPLLQVVGCCCGEVISITIPEQACCFPICFSFPQLTAPPKTPGNEHTYTKRKKKKPPAPLRKMLLFRAACVWRGAAKRLQGAQCHYSLARDSATPSVLPTPPTGEEQHFWIQAWIRGAATFHQQPWIDTCSSGRVYSIRVPYTTTTASAATSLEFQVTDKIGSLPYFRCSFMPTHHPTRAASSNILIQHFAPPGGGGGENVVISSTRTKILMRVPILTQDPTRTMGLLKFSQEIIT